MYAELCRGVQVGYNTVALLLRRAGLTDRTGAPTSDLVQRKFARAAPNEPWVTDITEHPAREGKVYCAVAHTLKQQPERDTCLGTPAEALDDHL